MEKEDVQQLVEGIVSLRLQSADCLDREMFGESRTKEHESDALETLLNDAGYTLEEDTDDVELFHVLAADGTEYASFHTGNWQWKESEQS